MNEENACSNAAFLDAMGYDPEDPGEDVEPGGWMPGELAMRRYRALDALHAVSNVAALAADAYARHKVCITNGRDPGYGYGQIAVIAGGPDPGDCLHSLTTFGAARSKLAHMTEPPAPCVIITTLAGTGPPRAA